MAYFESCLEIARRFAADVSLDDRAQRLRDLGIGGEEAYRESLPMLAAARRFYPEPGSCLLWTPLSAAMSAACLTDRFAKCEALATEALTTLDPSPRDDDPRVQTARGYLGLALAKRGGLTRARPLLEGALGSLAARRRTLPSTAKLQAALAATT